MAKRPLPSPEVFRQLLNYDARTGDFRWKERPLDSFCANGHSQRHNHAKWNARYAGKPAMRSVNGRGYRRAEFFGFEFLAHRVAWAIHYGVWPNGMLDHINGDKTDNRINNLREVSALKNQRNCKRQRTNTSGVTGVHWHKVKRMWHAKIYEKGKPIHIGYFHSLADAARARKAVEQELGFHENHGRS